MLKASHFSDGFKKDDRVKVGEDNTLEKNSPGQFLRGLYVVPGPSPPEAWPSVGCWGVTQGQVREDSPSLSNPDIYTRAEERSRRGQFDGNRKANIAWISWAQE